MSAEDKLKELMNMGYNIDIECKCAGRVYALTYEAVARKDNMFCAGMAVGNTLDELVDNLKESIAKFSSNSGDEAKITQ